MARCNNHRKSLSFSVDFLDNIALAARCFARSACFAHAARWLEKQLWTDCEMGTQLHDVCLAERPIATQNCRAKRPIPQQAPKVRCRHAVRVHQRTQDCDWIKVVDKIGRASCRERG